MTTTAWLRLLMSMYSGSGSDGAYMPGRLVRSTSVLVHVAGLPLMSSTTTVPAGSCGMSAPLMDSLRWFSITMVA